MRALTFAISLLVANLAHAESWLEMPNEAGGKIILTEYKCETNENGRLVIATTKEGHRIEGCWFYYTGMVHVVWKSGDKSSFEPGHFVIREDK